MAPFITHLKIAEVLWKELPAGPWCEHAGQFYFGNLAPDVDKLSGTLKQSDTHFFDRRTDYELMVTRRTTTFLQTQARFMQRPFDALTPPEQAFALGYLCHLATDEVSRHQWRENIYTLLQRYELRLLVVFSALDAWMRLRMQQEPTIVAALDTVSPPAQLIPTVPPADLLAMHRLVQRFMHAENPKAGFVAIIEDMFHIDPTEAAWRSSHFEEQYAVAEGLLHHFEPMELVERSLTHCRRRLENLFAGTVPEPGYPY